jgi:flagellar biosynthesis/type III secretory pathway protein FliH
MISALKLRNFDDDGSAPSHDPNQPTGEEVAALIAKAREEGRIGGYLAGAEDGRNEMRRTMQASQAEMLDSLTQQLAQLAATSAAQQEALVEQIVGFTLQTCEIVFPELIETMSVARVKKTALQSLKMAIGSSRIQVKLSPTTLAEIGPELHARATYYRCAKALELQADPDLADGDARMGWDHGSLDYGFRKICDRLLTELRETHKRAVEAQTKKD